MEKKQAEREKQKLEKEGKKRQQQQQANVNSKPKKPEEEEDIIGALMKEIRRGKTLRRRSEFKSGCGSHPSRSLKQDDIIRLYEETIIKEEAEDVPVQQKVELPTKEVDGGHAAAEKTVTAENQLLAVKQSRSKSEAFTGMQYSRRDQIRHSFHNMPHYETTV